MAQIDWLKVEIERLHERAWGEFFRPVVVHGTAGDNRATSPVLTVRTLLDLADSLPSGGPPQLAGIPIRVSLYLPNTDDRVVFDERPILRRIFTDRLCGVRVEEVPADYIFLLEHDGRRVAVTSPAGAALLRVYPEEVEL